MSRLNIASENVQERLTGANVPELTLRATNDEDVNLATLKGQTVVFIYPRTSPPNQPANKGWDLIPGAKGCTPQACAFRDQHSALLEAGANRVFGMSVQDTDTQREVAERLHLSYDLLSDAGFDFARALDLPCFEAGGMLLLKRLSLVIDGGRVEKVFYPVPESVQNAQDVISYLKSQ